MKLYVLQKAPNFGDQLNLLVFPKMLGPIFDDDASLVVLGIGTVIGARAPAGREEIILGAGAGYQTKRHSLERRKVYVVRGPETARLLGLAEQDAGIDPGVLVASLYPNTRAASQSMATLFMPHWQTDSSAGSHWRKACSMAGIEYVSPLDDSMAILERLRNCRLLITEALHGAVVAQCYGRPWIPVVLGPKVLDFKWHDWCSSIGSKYLPCADLPALRDIDERLGPAAHAKRAVAAIGLGKSRWRHIAVQKSTVADIEKAASALSRILTDADRHIHHGSAQAIEQGTDRLKTGIEAFQRDLAAGLFAK
jgi:succinoglycan biosynthesis protein ExoV